MEWVGRHWPLGPVQHVFFVCCSIQTNHQISHSCMSREWFALVDSPNLFQILKGILIRIHSMEFHWCIHWLFNSVTWFYAVWWILQIQMDLSSFTTPPNDPLEQVTPASQWRKSMPRRIYVEETLMSSPSPVIESTHWYVSLIAFYAATTGFAPRLRSIGCYANSMIKRANMAIFHCAFNDS